MAPKSASGQGGKGEKRRVTRVIENEIEIGLWTPLGPEAVGGRPCRQTDRDGDWPLGQNNALVLLRDQFFSVN